MTLAPIVPCLGLPGYCNSGYLLVNGYKRMYRGAFVGFFLFYFLFTPGLILRHTKPKGSMSRRRDSRSNVAVVGTGLAGLVTAYLLQNDPKNRYHVTLFERVRTLHRGREIHAQGAFCPFAQPLTSSIARESFSGCHIGITRGQNRSAGTSRCAYAVFFSGILSQFDGHVQFSTNSVSC